jgi:hypothetical protein
MKLVFLSLSHKISFIMQNEEDLVNIKEKLISIFIRKASVFQL